jgi:transposase InsO family protein
MLLTINQIITWHDDESGNKGDERVLHIFAETGEVVVIDTTYNKALPFFRSMDDLEDEIEKGNAIVIEGDPYAPRPFTEEGLESRKLRKIKHRRDKALKIIEPLFADENAVRMFFEQDRSALIAARLQEMSSWEKNQKACRQMIYTYCRRWWQNGQVPNAVISRYDNCGARRDKPRNVKKKLGRPSRLTQRSRKNGEQTAVTGANMKPEWLEKIILGGTLFYEHRLKPSMAWAYGQTLARFFIKGKTIENGKVKIITPDPNKGEIFSKGQFRYYYLLNRDPKRAFKKRSGPKKFNTRHRELRGKSTARGPGFRYLIDATLADVYLVSRYGPHLIVGRPVIWVMIDLYSRMITGFSVRFEGEGWLGLQLAIENTIEDKVAFCAKYGIKIRKDQWPARHRPVEILGDRGPLLMKAIHRFIKEFNVVVSNTPPYRPDWKGVIERVFGEMNIRVFNWLPGRVFPERDPGDPDYRLAAVLDIEELTALVIEAILHHNNECLISDGVEIDPAFLATGLDLYPTQFFTWGAEHRPGGLRETDFDAVRRSLLPEGRVSISKGEIKFKHPKSPKPLIYKCNQLQGEGLLLRDTGAKGRQYPALYDLRWADEIYLIRQAGGDLLPCALRDEDSIHVNRDWAEVVQYMDEVRARRDRQAPVILQDEINFDQMLKARVSKAKQKVKQAGEIHSIKSKSSRLRGIRHNRTVETERMHAEEASRFRSTARSGPAKPAPEDRARERRTGSGFSHGPQIPDIAELRKRRMGG